MQKKIILGIILILITTIMGFTNGISYASTEKKDANEIEVKVNYDEKTNTAEAKIISKVKLKETKPTWKLSEDKLVYTKKFTSNTSYSTPIVDINGKATNVKIEIKDIKILNISTKYDFNKLEGKVVATITSNIKLKNTKPTWKLSDDKLVYTKTYTSNMNYTTVVEDVYGTKKTITINVDKIGKEKPVLNIKNSYNEKTNTVTVQIISDVKLKNTKPTWKLNDNKTVYTKTFTSNTSYSTPVEDIYGNVVNANINVKEIDNEAPKITLEYKYNDDDTVTIYMKSNEKMKNTKPTWKLSADQLTYEKTYQKGDTYNTLVQDLIGNTTNVRIDFRTKKFEYVQEDKTKIKVRYLYINKSKAIVEIISPVKLKNTKPTWTLSKDGYRYTKTYYKNEMYTTPIQYENGTKKDINIMIDMFDNKKIGVDVSVHNGKINWQEVKNSGIDFAIIRCGYGQDIEAQDDKMFEYNISECERLGIPYGVYLYSYALNTDNASSEADHVLRLLKGRKPKHGIWIDIEDEEYYTNQGYPTNETLANIAITFLEKIKSKGYNDVGIYASLSWLEGKLNDSRLDKYQKWVAQWAESCNYSKPYKMWQYTSAGKVNGIEGNVDMDIYYN